MSLATNINSAVSKDSSAATGVITPYIVDNYGMASGFATGLIPLSFSCVAVAVALKIHTDA